MNALVIGDSFSAHSNYMKMWHLHLGERLNKMFYNRSSGGTGYLATGDGLPNRFSRQVAWRNDLAHPDTFDLVVIFGSVNDRFYIPTQQDRYRDAVYHTMLEARRVYKYAKQLIVGPQWCSTDLKPAALDVMTNILSQEMWNQNFDYGIQHPNLGADQTQWWFPQDRSDLRHTDNFHPSAGGQLVIANKLEGPVRNLLGL